MSHKHKEKEKEYDKQYYLDNKEKISTYTKQWKKDHPERVKETSRKFWFKYKYNLSYEDWVKMWVGQDGKCAICGEPFAEQSDAYVDHNHKTDEIRGLLCKKCNWGLGSFNDNPKLTVKATEYLLENN